MQCTAGIEHGRDTDPAACGDYGVEWDIDLHAVNWTFFDDQGRRVKLVQHVTEDNTVRNTVTGLTLRGGRILWSAGSHPVRELLDGSFNIRRALPAFCDILR